MKKMLIFLFVSLFVISGEAQHFINDIAYREQVHQDFLKRKEQTKGREDALYGIFKQKLTLQETEALEFLYAYMPLSDLADYDGNFFLNQVRTSFDARRYFTWGERVPEDIYRHFVLVYRVNNENLDSARQVFFQELKERVHGLSMYEAALEVNHWCHEKVAYRPSDGRTSAPLATVKTALGRCGEESTFTVTAMRAVGIPARQCYTPRWAHTDDNHAWVEVWVDGKWYFLGACEPDPELNMGWFAIPSTRTMMVHSNAFGKYNQNEEVTLATNLFSRVNMLSNYTDTKKITVTVLNADNKPVENATVKFKLYNYAEYYSIATQQTNAAGKAEITTGLGDLLIWASFDNHYNYQKIDVRESSSITLIMNRIQGKEYVEELTIVPPVEKHDIVTASPEKAKLNSARLHYEDSLRNAYMQTFMTENDGNLVKNENLTSQQIGYLLQKSEGNYAEIIQLLEQNSKKVDGLYLNDLMLSLSEKDLRDLDASIIQQHITYYKPNKYNFDCYLKGIISPRISNEGIRPWRQFLKSHFEKELQNNISVIAIMAWIQEHIQIDEVGNYFNCPISPRGVCELRISDRHSRDIFFVAACRSLDIPAYLDNATNQLFAYENNKWNYVSFDLMQNLGETGTLTIDYQGDAEITPTYWTHYTIAKFENGDFVTFDYENDPRVANFPFSLTLDAGYYMLSTGNRYSDGTTLSRLDFFNIPAGKEVKKSLIIRDLLKRNETYGVIQTDYSFNIDNQIKTVQQLMNGNTMLVCFIDPTLEPTKHLLNDLAARKSDFEKWGGTMLFVVPSDKLSADFNFDQWQLPSQSILMEDKGNQWFNKIITDTDQYFRDNYPVVYLIKNDGMIIFKSEGYRIGTGNLILNTLKTE
ncbi:MAG: transglutaminase domain-containing protein [Bacteroidales bacterium]|jgi:hypothetical protein|nr:transglutaminase domain-containing protein [Bacteroidales bacterium]MDD4394414.1 transglutaminase domain-containing protein [Bacteroidales bacterium]